MKQITKQWGVVYNEDKVIATIKTPENSVYPANDSLIFECDSEEEMKQFISQNQLREFTYENFTTDNNE